MAVGSVDSSSRCDAAIASLDKAASWVACSRGGGGRGCGRRVLNLWLSGELLEVHEVHVAQVRKISLENAMRHKPVLDEADDGIGAAIVDTPMPETPRMGGVSVAHGMAQDDKEVGIRKEGLQEPSSKEARRRLLQDELRASLPVCTPLSVELRGNLGAHERTGLSQVCQRIEGKKAWATEGVVGRENALGAPAQAIRSATSHSMAISPAP